MLIMRGDEVLLIHRKNTGWMDEKWGLPAGHIEGTETVAQAAIRETEEEVGIRFSEQDVTLRHVMHRPSSTGRVYFDFFFTAEVGNQEPRNTEPDKHDEVRWFKLSDLPENTIPYLKRVPERIKNSIFFSEDVTT